MQDMHFRVCPDVHVCFKKADVSKNQAIHKICMRSLNDHAMLCPCATCHKTRLCMHRLKDDVSKDHTTPKNLHTVVFQRPQRDLHVINELTCHKIRPPSKFSILSQKSLIHELSSKLYPCATCHSTSNFHSVSESPGRIRSLTSKGARAHAPFSNSRLHATPSRLRARKLARSQQVRISILRRVIQLIPTSVQQQVVRVSSGPVHCEEVEGGKTATTMYTGQFSLPKNVVWKWPLVRYLTKNFHSENRVQSF